ncbi:hypothetical protein [Aeromonas sp. FDAARGOS 1408]|uniref:hypothetical protein n=1 Tax=Aeromonas TaxID=642 RepID=UPI001C234621|nr:hypothetical protein [Aeromonas sp. FDAARGOS 1408]QXC08678.1 hypothetical protein I6L38_01650 [Aeromonas sp. FDAARGOS 1408]
MEAVSNLVVLMLVVVIPIAFFVGMVNPARVKAADRKQVFFRAVGVWLVGFVLLMIVVPRDGKPDQTKADEGSAKVEEEPAKQPEPASKSVASYDNRQLSWFIDLGADERREVVGDLVAAAAIDRKETEAFYTCLSDYASSKSKELGVKDVFGWCVREYKNNAEMFRGHFNELDAKDLSVMGYIMCKRFVETQLLSPSSADFPFSSDGAWSMGRQRYVYKLHVDSQNAYGAMVRTNWHCDVKFKGGSETGDINSWTLNNLEQQ